MEQDSKVAPRGGQALASSLRTHTCGELRSEHDGISCVLCGWVHHVRDHGGVIFVSLRDRYGITQLTHEHTGDDLLTETMRALTAECCIRVCGTVRMRPTAMRNDAQESGEIEVVVREITLLSACAGLPFQPSSDTESKDELRQKFRYLDMRSTRMRNNMLLRHRIMQATRTFLVANDFLEIETPTLIRSVPEGARDLLVPSRLHPHSFYALAQSPQLYKQLLMIGGYDRYFQLARCYRDEDARGDRQIEHTQLDIEMSFVQCKDIYEMIERLVAHIFATVLEERLPTPFPRFTYDEARLRYCSDKPDIRFALRVYDCSDWAQRSGVRFFADACADGGVVRMMHLPECAPSRAQIDTLEALGKSMGAKGLAWARIQDGTLHGGIAKLIDEARARELMEGAEPRMKHGDTLLFLADMEPVVIASFNVIRLHIIAQMNPRREAHYINNEWGFAWITDFPLFERNEDEGRWDAAHHVFSMPYTEYIERLEESPGEVRGEIYDLVCNGNELASGSMRIYSPSLQKRIFSIIGLSEEEATRRFGFLLEAFRYGPPPHGGIAPGLDRLTMLLAGEKSIREVIAFPKNSNAASLLDGSPATVDDERLREVSIMTRAGDAKKGDNEIGHRRDA